MLEQYSFIRLKFKSIFLLTKAVASPSCSNQFLRSMLLIINLVHYIQVFLTPTELAIVMEYAAGGELFERICNAGRFSEDEVHALLLSYYFHYELWFPKRFCAPRVYSLICYNQTIQNFYLSGTILLSTANIRSKLLSFNGKNCSVRC